MVEFGIEQSQVSAHHERQKKYSQKKKSFYLCLDQPSGQGVESPPPSR
jgi:hypothetical protein